MPDKDLVLNIVERIVLACEKENLRMSSIAIEVIEEKLKVDKLINCYVLKGSDYEIRVGLLFDWIEVLNFDELKLNEFLYEAVVLPLTRLEERLISPFRVAKNFDILYSKSKKVLKIIPKGKSKNTKGYYKFELVDSPNGIYCTFSFFLENLFSMVNLPSNVFKIFVVSNKHSKIKHFVLTRKIEGKDNILCLLDLGMSHRTDFTVFSDESTFDVYQLLKYLAKNKEEIKNLPKTGIGIKINELKFSPYPKFKISFVKDADYLLKFNLGETNKLEALIKENKVKVHFNGKELSPDILTCVMDDFDTIANLEPFFMRSLRFIAKSLEEAKSFLSEEAYDFIEHLVKNRRVIKIEEYDWPEIESKKTLLEIGYTPASNEGKVAVGEISDFNTVDQIIKQIIYAKAINSL